ncbi:MAG TPA: hypothetical protein VKE98_15755 [Gemmataceae bacterium]|nr:hypothetical protein [Gemmataceae bacterium]
MADPIRNSDNHHTTKIRGMLDEVIQHVRADIAKVEDPQIRALFETTAEVLGGLSRAYAHAEKKSGSAWR